MRLMTLLAAVACLAQTERPGAPADATQAQITEALKKVCPAADLLRSEHGDAVGCRHCPPGTDFANHDFTWELRRATVGRFTSPASEEIVLSGRGCEPHSMYFGGSFLLRSSSRSWKLLRYAQGLITDDCHRIRRRDGRDALVCKDQTGFQGTGWQFVYSVQFDAAGKGETTPIFETKDSIGTCGEDLDGNFLRRAQQSGIDSFEVRDLNGDGVPDLTINATFGTKAISEKDRDACRAEWEQLDRDPQVLHQALQRALSVPTRQYKLEFVFDGIRYTPTPQTRSIMKLFPKPREPVGF